MRLSVRAESRTCVGLANQTPMKKLKHLYVYILECSDKSYYTGITNNPERRVEQHNEGVNKNSYTYRRPVKIISNYPFCGSDD